MPGLEWSPSNSSLKPSVHSIFLLRRFFLNTCLMTLIVTALLTFSFCLEPILMNCVLLWNYLFHQSFQNFWHQSMLFSFIFSVSVIFYSLNYFLEHCLLFSWWNFPESYQFFDFFKNQCLALMILSLFSSSLFSAFIFTLFFYFLWVYSIVLYQLLP